MGKIAALFILLLVGNAAFLVWLYFSRRRSGGSNTSSNGEATHDHSKSANRPTVGSGGADQSGPGCGTNRDATVSPGPEVPRRTADGGVVYHDSARDTPVNNDADREPCPAPAVVTVAQPEGPFLVPPMVQIGKDASRLDCVEVIFFAPTGAHGFTFNAFSDRKLDVAETKPTAICVQGVVPHKRFTYTISGLKPGEKFKYWVNFGGKVVFEANAAARMAPGSPHRFVVVGDMGNGSVESMRIAHRIYSEYKPDLLAITGDVVYMLGRASEYLRRFLPVYNARVVDPGVGVPMLSEILSFTSLGNHCVGKMDVDTIPNLNDHPDLHAFFMYWSLPLNGPLSNPKATGNIPELRGDVSHIQRFLTTVGERFPRMGNYSFDYGDVHWLVLDANAYMDWTDAELRAWVVKDLSAARSTRWKFVNFHQPGFSSNPKHGLEKRMRLLAGIFEEHGVDVVFTGHCHYYERSFPLRFAVEPNADGSLIDKDGQVAGDFTLDKTFDGVTVTKPNGVIYITSGAGGAKLDPSGIHWRPEDWKPFTHKLIADRHSFTVADLAGDKLTLRQIDLGGKEIDKLVITK
ncbi:MAG: metallophosphoesterase [Candidatus Melainabacteria bacterium]|nr:metallophosphoesterase [Candidatus Melainabacteria bacterium]